MIEDNREFTERTARNWLLIESLLSSDDPGEAELAVHGHLDIVRWLAAKGGSVAEEDAVENAVSGASCRSLPSVASGAGGTNCTTLLPRLG